MPTLRELDAEFVGEAKANGSFQRLESLAGAQGLLFECPLRDGHSILVWFAGRGVPDVLTPSPRWSVAGSGIDDLTLSPSINLDVKWKDEKGVEHDSACKWHGFVTNGVAK